MNTNVHPEERRAFYELVACCYLQEPTEENVRNIDDLLHAVDQCFTHLSLVDLLHESETRCKLLAESPDSITDLQQNFYDHFIVPTAPSFIPPYASALEGIQKKPYQPLWGKKTHTVLACYDAVGFKPCSVNASSIIKDTIIPDHIGYQLAFMAYLCASESNTEDFSSRWVDLQKQFLVEHLVDFSLTFAKLARSKSNAFYLSLIETVYLFASWDLARE